MVSVGNVIVLYGGTYDLFAPRLDTWVWDGVGWSDITPAASPTRGMPAMATVGDHVVMFNGSSTWLLTLVHRRAVDLVRREDRRRAEPLTESVETPSTGSAEDDAWLRFERERVQTALKQLPDQQREALELAYYGGFTQSELAERLGEPVGTIKSRMFTGLARLRELLGEPRPGEAAWKPTPYTT